MITEANARLALRTANRHVTFDSQHFSLEVRAMIGHNERIYHCSFLNLNFEIDTVKRINATDHMYVIIVHH